MEPNQAKIMTSKAQGKGRFGKGRTLGCRCEYGFTCRPCLDMAAVKGRTPA